MSYTNRVSQLAFWSIVIALVVMAIKFAAWWVTGSVALYSDALESIVNVAASTIAWVAIRLSRIPADHNHNYGHHKAEYFSAIIEGVLIVLAALLIFNEAYSAFKSEHVLQATGLGMAINIVATLINGAWAWILITVGRREGSPALVADGRHIRADVVTSIGVLIGLAITFLTGWIILDAIMAILVGLNILREGWVLVAGSVNNLMDMATDDEQTKKIESVIIDNMTGAIEVHDIRTRVSGPLIFVEFHLIVDGAMSVSKSHEICDQLESALRQSIKGAQTTIHVEPDHKRKGSGLQIE